MDSVLSAIVGVAPQLGGGGLLLALLALVIRREQQSAERFSAELTRVNTAHDAELAELRAEIKELRADVRQVNQQLDAALARARAAENASSHPTGDEQWRR